MPRQPDRYTLIVPSAAAWLFRRSDARLRRLALDGELPTRTVKWASKPARAYLYTSLVERWGKPHPDRLGALLRLESFQVTSEGGAVWEILVLRPVVLDDAGDLAISMEDGK